MNGFCRLLDIMTHEVWWQQRRHNKTGMISQELPCIPLTHPPPLPAAIVVAVWAGTQGSRWSRRGFRRCPPWCRRSAAPARCPASAVGWACHWSPLYTPHRTGILHQLITTTPRPTHTCATAAHPRPGHSQVKKFQNSGDFWDIKTTQSRWKKVPLKSSTITAVTWSQCIRTLFVSYLQHCHSKIMSFSFQGPHLGLRLTWAGTSTPWSWYKCNVPKCN